MQSVRPRGNDGHEEIIGVYDFGKDGYLTRTGLPNHVDCSAVEGDTGCAWRKLVCALRGRPAASSRGYPTSIVMMQASDLREGNDLAHLGWLDWPRRRTVVVK